MDQPNRFHASPAEIDAFLREHFAEDVLLNFYRTVGDEVLDEALQHGRQHRAAKEQSGSFKHIYLAGMADVMDEIWDFRYYPAKLPQLDGYTRPFNPPRWTPPQEDFDALLEDSSLGAPRVKAVRERIPEDVVRERLAEAARTVASPEPQNDPCYRTKAHDAHDWLKGRRRVHCLGNPR
jgi:hypothetical protein